MSENENETEQPILGHFATYTFTSELWKLDPPLHTGVLTPADEWAESLG